jgi:hypothetical protein
LIVVCLTSRRSQPPLARSVPLSRFTSRVGGGSAFFVRRTDSTNMARCSVCNSFFIWGSSSGSEKFCSLACLTYSPLRNFCKRCLEETTNESPGNTTSVNLVIGTMMVDGRDRCPDCHSIVRRKLRLCLFFYYTVARYRVIYVEGSRYVGRRLKKKA